MRFYSAELPVFKGMKVMITKNVNQGLGIVNGSMAEVVGLV